MRNFKFFYNYSHIPGSSNLKLQLENAAKRLYDKLIDFDLNSLDISDYIKRYFGDKINRLKHNLKKNTYILSSVLANTSIPLDKFVFLDYGGGSGILSLLAKELGIGTIILNDINPVCVNDAKVIGYSLENEANYYIQGDIDDLIRFLDRKNINCDAIASYDVIEHIYDIESFLKKLQFLSKSSIKIFMGSGANKYNPIINKQLKKKQRSVEFYHQENYWGRDKRDALTPFFEIRKDIIIDCIKVNNKYLNEKEVNILTKNTRGLTKSDIIKCVHKYLKYREIPDEPYHKTNTCDPNTGNWCEHLLNPFELAEILSKTGIESTVFCGFYGHRNNILINLIMNILNINISILRDKGLFLAPFYSIIGKRQN